ncbi:hypothetical protein KIW84_044836 [Lathyrus oleraceus]|uniref:RNA-directed DNA polymerase (Reverse transcriptase) n=1 Tax=Pisum sativum TaxID=3888 RepID=A0A9D4XM14_PEA|nr:hypothetical protein KIW84_044836 [Pisum sativum]
MAKHAETKLQVMQERIYNSGHSNFLLNLEKNAQLDQNNALKIEEMFWLEKSRIKWHTDGDRHTRHTLNHYQNLFSAKNVLQGNNLINDAIPHLMDDYVNRTITLAPSPEEIKNVVFSLNKDNALAPDGFDGFFYQTYWDIILKYVCNVVLEFFST